LPALIRSWRSDWPGPGAGGKFDDMPFVFVQLPAGLGLGVDDGSGGEEKLAPTPNTNVQTSNQQKGPRFRNAFLNTLLSMPSSTGMVVSTDLDGHAPHPRHKERYGRRFGRVVANSFYQL